MTTTLRLYKEHLMYPGSEDSLYLTTDWMEILLDNKFPVWKKIREWGHYIQQQYAEYPEGYYPTGRQIQLDDLSVGIGKQLPLFKLRWPLGLAEALALIRKITIFRGAIRQLPEWIGQLPQLQELTISEREAAPIGDNFKQSPIWKSLPPLEIPAWLADAPRLTELNLDNSTTTIRFDSDFCRRSQIHELRISNVQNMVSTHAQLANLSALQYLGVGNVASMDFFSILPVLHSLKKLFVACPLIQEIPSEIRSLTYLKFLGLESNQLITIPSWITELTQLKWLSVQYSQESIQKSIKRDISEFPIFLLNCPNLEWVQIQTSRASPIRSLYGLSPRAQYWVALRAAYPDSDSEFYLDLPHSIYRKVHIEFQSFRSDNVPIEQWDSPFNRSHWKAYIPCSFNNLNFYSQYTNQPSCVNCNRPLTNYNCDRCHLHYDVAPSLHQSLITFLAEYYRDSFDDLMQRVKDVIILSNDERERFVHECDYHYWQILMNDKLPTHDSLLLDALTAKFSVQLPEDHRMLL